MLRRAYPGGSDASEEDVSKGPLPGALRIKSSARAYPRNASVPGRREDVNPLDQPEASKHSSELERSGRRSDRGLADDHELVGRPPSRHAPLPGGLDVDRRQLLEHQGRLQGRGLSEPSHIVHLPVAVVKTNVRVVTYIDSERVEAHAEGQDLSRAVTSC